MYRVIQRFHDLQDDLHEYCADDIYPRKGYVPSEERIAELSGSGNAQKHPLIVLVDDAAAPEDNESKPKRKRKTAEASE